jgi:hypothetical protein
MLSHVEAAEVFRQAFRQVNGRLPSIAERQGIQSLSWRETNYGAGWKDPGAGSWNMGAIASGLPPCGPGSFEYTDSVPDESGGSTTYQHCFKTYASPVDGAADVVRKLTVDRPTVWAAFRAGDLWTAGRELYRTRYMQSKGRTEDERIAHYIQPMADVISLIAKANGEPIALTIIPPASSLAKASTLFLGVALGALAGHFAYQTWRQERA